MVDIELKRLKKNLNRKIDKIIRKDLILENKLKKLKKQNRMLKRRLR